MKEFAAPINKYFGPPGSMLADVVLLLIVFTLLYGMSWAGSGMFEAFYPPEVQPSIDLDPINLPFYAARSMLRMFIALACSLVFTLAYAYIAAKNKIASRFMIPLLDVLQSVPVLGFLSVSVTGFIAMFPGHLLGLELASIFAIFTSQVWNMTFSFYYSLISLPKELEQVVNLFRLNRLERFIKLELPAGVISLVWNAMVSFGGGWFFLAASESISVLNRSYTLPGIGSYVTKAVLAKDLQAIFFAVLTMSIVIVLIDQLFWKPLVAWSDRFKLDRSSAASEPTSWVLELMRASQLLKLLKAFFGILYHRLNILDRSSSSDDAPISRSRWLFLLGRHQLFFGAFLGVLLTLALQHAIRFIGQEVSLAEFMLSLKFGLFTFLRVIALVALATLVWTPLGVMIGMNPRLARVAQPLVQFLSSFPANFVFPFATLLFVKFGISINWGSLFLMCLGAQWYILFNVIAGAAAIPSDLREMALNMRLQRLTLWRRLIIPAIFPAWLTGAITASGGAWNASIVSEVVSWGDTVLLADGLGAYISRATLVGDWPRIVLGVFLMSSFVVITNRFFWRRLYELAQDRYRIGA